MKKWIVDKEHDKTIDHYVHLRLVEDDDEDTHWLAAGVKWDGCIHLWKAYNEPFKKFAEPSGDPEQNMEYTHICDLDDYIENLISLRDSAKAYFSQHTREWPPT